MPEYRVSWVIEIEAESPREAAERALEIQRNPESTAVVFDVAVARGLTIDITVVDLLEDDSEWGHE